MTPLRVVAELEGPIGLPAGPLALDSLLIWSECQRRQLPPPGFGPLVDVDIPVAKSPCGRVYLASFSIATFELYERRYTQRRFPIEQAVHHGAPKLQRINISAGAQKSYRIPMSVQHAEHDTLAWFLVGDEAGVRDLLSCVTHLGKRRAVGRGRVLRWIVEPCTSWGDGFPVVRDGRALRALPLDWPGLVDPVQAMSVLAPPYWDHAREEFCAVPEG